jgi:MFS transporter, DHA1 family, multidrug resistance protein
MKNPYILSLPIALATITVMLATDLYLPAVPSLHETLGGTAVDGQYTLASFIAAFAVGQLIIGALGDRYDKRIIMVVSLGAFSVVSLLCAVATDMTALIVLRGLQGFVSAAGVALAPAMIRELGDEMTTIKLIGFVSSVEALIPALAPALGAWLIVLYGWEVTFFIVSATALMVTGVFLFMPARAEKPAQAKLDHPVLIYAKLLANRRFMAFTLGHAFGIGALMTFIFAAPYVMTTLYGRGIDSFVWMQAFLIGSFILAANLGGPFAQKVGVGAAITTGSLVQLAGGLGLLSLSLLHDAPSTAAMTVAMIPVNAGLGLRAGSTFTRAMDAANAPDGSTGALMIFLISLVMSAGTALVAPYLQLGLWTVGIAVTAQLVLSVALLVAGTARAVKPQPLSA